MKARRKSDGEIVSVEAIVYNANNGERYSPSELDFNVDAEKISSLEEEIRTYAKMCSVTEEDYTAIRKAVEHGISMAKSDAEETVISGWVARDKCGFISIFSYRPNRVIKEDLGFWGHGDESHEIDLPRDFFPSVTWESGPKKVRLIVEDI